MEGDKDEIDTDAVRADIIKTHMRLENIDEERRLNKLKELYDSSLNPGNQFDRSFRSRLHENDFDWTKLVGDPLNNENSQSDGEESEEEEVITFKEHLIREQIKAKDEEEVGMVFDWG